MSNQLWKPKVIGEFSGFTIVLSFEPEHMNMRNHFINECEWSEEQFNEIKNFKWFIAKVTAYKGSIECGSTYLGGNCDKSLKDVMGDGKVENILSGYMPQMIEDVVQEAEAALTGQLPLELHHE